MKNKLNIIAEIAQGFEGNFEQSKLLIKAAAKAGADSVKFQLVYADELATADYQYYALFKELEMEEAQWKLLKDYASSLGIQLIVDVFGARSLKTAESIGIKEIKIHGTDLTNISLLKKIRNSKIKKVILGLGGAYWEEIKKVLKILEKKELVLLCGFQGYATKTKDNQIKRLQLIKEKTINIHSNFSMGFADHPVKNKFKNTISLVAVGAGAQVIEKHLTLGKVMELEDYESAINPDEFRKFIEQIRAGEKALGKTEDRANFLMSEAEEIYRKNVRKDVVANSNLEAGIILRDEDLYLIRTGLQNTIKKLEFAVGQKLINPIKKNSPILLSDIAK